MSKLLFEHTHTLTLQAAREATQRVADEMARDYNVHCAWEGDVLNFNRSGVKGTLTVTHSKIQLDAKLGVLLAAFKPRIEERLNANFTKYYG